MVVVVEMEGAPAALDRYDEAAAEAKAFLQLDEDENFRLVENVFYEQKVFSTHQYYAVSNLLMNNCNLCLNASFRRKL